VRKDLDAFFKATERWHLPPPSNAPCLALALLFRGMTGFNAVAAYLAQWAQHGTKI